MQLARTTDPETSHQAAEDVSSRLRESQAAVLVVLALNGPSTDQELTAKYHQLAAAGAVPPQSESGIRSRRAELVRIGTVRDTGLRDRTRSGRRTIVWEAR
jgi:hypothetical protein